MATRRSSRWDVALVEASGVAADLADCLRRELERYDLSVRLLHVPPPAEPGPETLQDARTALVLLPHGSSRVAFLLFDHAHGDVESGPFTDRDIEPLARFVAARLGRTERAIEVHVDTDRWRLAYGKAALKYELDRAWGEPDDCRRLDLIPRTPLAVIQSGAAIAERPDLVEGIAWLLARPPLLDGMTTAEVAAAVDSYVRLHRPEPRRGMRVALWHAGEAGLRTTVVLAERVPDLVPVAELDRAVLVERVLPAIVAAVVKAGLGARSLMESPNWRVGGT